jgi:ribosomal-protein-alanine N-acetyltransferase
VRTVATLHPSRREVGDQRFPLAIDLQPMRRRHVPQVLDIERRVYPRPWTMTLFLSEIVQRSTRYYIVARVRRRVVGYAGLMVFGDEAHVTNIAVDPDVHRRKVAARLLFALITEARRRGASACTLEVRVANHAAQGLYHQFGFAPVGIRKNYYAETGEDALIMWAEGLQTPAYAERLAALAARIPEPREVG